MKTRLLAIVATVLLLIPALTQSVAFTVAEQIMPGDFLATADIKLTDKFSDLLKDLAEEVADDERLEVLTDILLDGKRLFVSVDFPNVIVSIPITDGQFETLSADSNSHTYESTEVYETDEGLYLAKVGDFAVLSNSQDGIHQAVDLADGKSSESLFNNTQYSTFTSSYINPHFFSFTINMESAIELLDSFLGGGMEENDDDDDDDDGEEKDDNGDEDTPEEKAFNSISELLSLFEMEGFSVGEVSNGYKFNAKILGNSAKMQEKGFSLNPGGSFTPNLYTKFANAKPILYSELFNPKANNDESQKIMDMLKESFGDDADIFAAIKQETGFDLNALYDAFTEEFAIGVQYDQNSPLPYVTIMGNVSKTKTAATKLIKNLVKLVLTVFEEEDVPKRAYKVTEEGGFTKITFDVTKAHEYFGPPFPVMIFTFGVSDDGLLIVSNHPGIEDSANRTGFASNPDFSSAMNEETGPNTGIFYLSPRNLWGFFDAMAAWGERAGGGEHGPPLDFYQGYYSMLDIVYSWRDLFVVSKSSEYETTVTGTIRIDEAKHKSYEQLLEELKSSDRDGDGVSDYDERYVYHTPADSGDSDSDGTNDFEELEKGYNPEGEGRLFKDVDENAYYTDEVGFMYQRGAIKGYSDQTFQPGKLVNRAEFITMVVKTFEQDTSSFLGVEVELGTKTPPFTDVDALAWYYPNVSKAYTAGWISGSQDASGNLVFRPGENIIRAEALAILNKASEALGKTQSTASCENSPFKDVSNDAWYCGAVANGYANGVTKGRAADRFDPAGYLNRAEAAVMIRRTLEKDLESFASGTESLGELSAPLLPGIGRAGGTGGTAPIPFFKQQPQPQAAPAPAPMPKPLPPPAPQGSALPIESFVVPR